MSLRLITGPAVEPVTLAELRAQCRVDPDNTTEDALLSQLIVAARRQAEHITGRSFVNQTYERVLDAFPRVELELGVAPVVSVTSVSYLDTNEDTQVLSSAAYVLDADSNLERGFILPAYGYVWPATHASANAVRVQFVAGYGADATNVPADAKAWMLLRAATLFKHREETVTGVSSTALPRSFTDGLLDSLKVYGHA